MTAVLVVFQRDQAGSEHTAGMLCLLHVSPLFASQGLELVMSAVVDGPKDRAFARSRPTLVEARYTAYSS